MPDSSQPEAAEEGEILVSVPFGNKVSFDPDSAAKRRSDKKEKARRKRQKSIAERAKAIQLLPKVQLELDQERKRSDLFSARSQVRGQRQLASTPKLLERQAVEWADRIAVG